MIRNLKLGRSILNRLLFAFALSFINFLALAQEKGIDVDINVKDESEWYQQPWVWVVGAAIFILLLVALLRSGSPRKG